MTTVPQLSRAMKTLLTTTADRLATATGFVQRVSPLTGGLFARILVFSWWADPAATCEARADMAQALGCPVSKQALDQRFGPAAAAFLQALLGAAVQVAVAADPVAVPVLRRFAHIELCDGSVITLPDTLAPTWAGCGPGIAALKLLLRFDLVTGQLHGPVLAPGRVHDRAAAVELPPLPPGSLHIGDLGFFALEQFAAWGAAGCFWLSRLRGQVAVYDAAGTRLDLPTWLAAQCPHRLDAPVQLGTTMRVPARLLAARVPAAVVAERRARLREEAARRQTGVSAEEWALAEWTLLVTNSPAHLLSPEEALALGQARWQIELLIKRWKSLGQIDEWRSAKPWRILTEIYGKLLVLVLQHWLLVLGCWLRPDRSLWRGVVALQARGRSLARAWGQAHWETELAEALAALARCRIDKRRGAVATYQRLVAAPPPAVELLAA